MTEGKKGLSDSEVKALVDQEAFQALGYVGKLTEQRKKALEYYAVKATGDLAPPEIEGRSSVVSPDVADAIEGAMPSLMRIFCSGDEVVRFDPRKPGDEDQAQMATDYINWLLFTQNEGWKIIYWWIKDALLSKNGVVKVFCDESTEITEESYSGLTENQMASLVKDDEIKVLEHSEEPDTVDEEHRKEAQEQLTQLIQQIQTQPAPQQPGQPPQPDPRMQQAQQIQQNLAQPPLMLHSIKVRRKHLKRKVTVQNVPPEEFLISRQAKSIDDTPFVGHRVQRSLSDLIASGYDEEQVMRLSDDNNWAQYNMESIERRINDDEITSGGWDNQTTDKMSRKVWLLDCYIQADVDGDGYAEWRHVLKAGFEILENEMCDGPNFADMTPVLMPHRFFGLSMADQIVDWQRVKTALLRQLLDALYLGNNPRYEAVEGKVNFDDLLTSRPGGVVRSKAIGSVAILGTADVSGTAIKGLQFFDEIVQQRSGVQNLNQGLDANTLNKTASGVNMLQQASMQKLELIARAFAETGFKRLFRLMLKTAIRYQNKAEMVRLNGKWVEIDPREWKTGFDLTISVGLGTGNRDQQEAHLQRLLAAQLQLLQFGVTTPANLYETAKKLPNVLGFKNDEAFFTDPAQNPQQQHPNPEVIKGQVQQQIAQANGQVTMQVENAKIQAQMQLEQHKAQLQAQVDQAEQAAQERQTTVQQQNDLQIAQHKAGLDQQTELARIQHEKELEMARLQAQAVEGDKERANKVLIAQIAAGVAIQNAALAAENKADMTVAEA